MYVHLVTNSNWASFLQGKSQQSCWSDLSVSDTVRKRISNSDIAFCEHTHTDDPNKPIREPVEPSALVRKALAARRQAQAW